MENTETNNTIEETNNSNNTEVAQVEATLVETTQVVPPKEETTQVEAVETATKTIDETENVAKENAEQGAEQVAEKEAFVRDENFEAATNQDALTKQQSMLIELKTEIENEEKNIESSDDLRINRKNLVSLNERVQSLFLLPIADREELETKIQVIYQSLSDKIDAEKEKLRLEYEENLNKIKPDFEALIKEVEESTDFKTSRQKLIDFQTKVKKSDIKPSDKDGFLTTIQEHFENINKKQEDERESYEMECSENYLNLKSQIEPAVASANANSNFKEARQALIATQGLIRGVKLKKNNRDSLYQIIRNSFDALNTKQDVERKEINEKSDENIALIQPEVDKACTEAANPSNYNQSRNALIDLQNKIKTLALTRQVKDKLFGQIREVFSKLNDLQENDREGFGKEADENFTKLEVKVNEAILNIEYSNDFRDIREGLIAVQDDIKILSLKRHHRNELFKRIRKAFDAFDVKRNAQRDRRNADKKGRLSDTINRLEAKIKKNQQQVSDAQAKLVSLNTNLETAQDDEKLEFTKQIETQTQKVKEAEGRLNDLNANLTKLKSELPVK